MSKFCHVGRTQSPCYGCHDRSAECHSSCEKYKQFEQIHAKERREIHQKKHQENLAYGAPYRTERQINNVRTSFDSTCTILRRQKKEGKRHG